MEYTWGIIKYLKSGKKFRTVCPISSIRLRLRLCDFVCEPMNLWTIEPVNLHQRLNKPRRNCKKKKKKKEKSLYSRGKKTPPPKKKKKKKPKQTNKQKKNNTDEIKVTNWKKKLSQNGDFHTMLRRNNPPKVFNHAAVRVKDSIVFIGASFQVRPRTVWVCNLYTEQWRIFMLCATLKAPSYEILKNCSGFAIGHDIYAVTAPQNHMATLWKLTTNRINGCFNFLWSDIVVNRAPSFRENSAGWEYGDKLWMFGGHGPNPAEVGYVNENVDFKHNEWVYDIDRACYITYGFNNQLICFEPSRREWTSLKCSGNVPSPQCHSAAVIGDEAYVYAKTKGEVWLNNFHKLDMRNLTWAEIRTVPQIPKPIYEPSLNGIIGNQLVFHGIQKLNMAFPGIPRSHTSKMATWILDVDSMSFREYTATMDHYRIGHRGVRGLNSCVMISGNFDHPMNSICWIRLEPKSLQKLATTMIFENRKALPWEQLPLKLIKQILGLLPEEQI